MPLIQPPAEKQPTFEPETGKDELKGQVKEFIWETLKVIVISLAIIIPIRCFVIQPFYVKGASMEPNFYDHEYLVINEIGYRLDEPERGDVIVFKYPYDRSQYFIKRVIGLPGETIEIKDGDIMINNNILNEDLYLPNTHTNGTEKLELGPTEYYIMGDNRSSSLDSRMFGPIDRSDIVGKTWIRGFPFNRIKVFNDSAYQ